jgi:diadenosine tetraphosphate (Ap4A) HIT family hydrolase
MPSIFSRIVSGELPAHKVAEDADHLAFLDITPLVEGHTLVIPKKEIDYIFDLSPEALAALNVFAQRVAKGVQAAVPCKRIGVAVIGLEVPHAHIHLIPMNKVADMNFANPKIKVPAERMQELATAIAAKVEGGSGLAAASASSPTPPAAADDATTAQLQKMTAGLNFISESDAPLEAVSYDAPAGDLPNSARSSQGRSGRANPVLAQPHGRQRRAGRRNAGQPLQGAADVYEAGTRGRPGVSRWYGPAGACLRARPRRSRQAGRLQNGADRNLRPA